MKMQPKVLLILFLTLFSSTGQADWQCYTVDGGGHYWTSTGMTEERASTVAMNFCSANSPNGASCQVNKCFER